MKHTVARHRLVNGGGQQRQHVFLARQLHAVVHLTVEMYGDVRDEKQRTAYVQQTRHRMQYIIATQHDTPCKAQRTVEPCAHNRTAIHLRVQRQHAAAQHLG